jgi:hypothetical protein
MCQRSEGDQPGDAIPTRNKRKGTKSRKETKEVKTEKRCERGKERKRQGGEAKHSPLRVPRPCGYMMLDPRRGALTTPRRVVFWILLQVDESEAEYFGALARDYDSAPHQEMTG